MAEKNIANLVLHGMEIRFKNRSSNNDLNFSVEAGYGYLMIIVEDKFIPMQVDEFVRPKRKRGRPRKETT